MIAHYGYKDGSGEYFISINTDHCKECDDKPCTKVCPQGVLEIVTDDYDDLVCAVKEEFRKKIKYVCAPCKPIQGRSTPVCIASCLSSAMVHSW